MSQFNDYGHDVFYVCYDRGTERKIEKGGIGKRGKGK